MIDLSFKNVYQILVKNGLSCKKLTAKHVGDSKSNKTDLLNWCKHQQEHFPFPLLSNVVNSVLAASFEIKRVLSYTASIF